MKDFDSSFIMNQFMKEKEFVYNSKDCTFTKNGHIYILWIIATGINS
jgi:hypothetical protein